jgi:ubiquinone/menaquinone biosynthesis C-methylase UbiE
MATFVKKKLKQIQQVFKTRFLIFKDGLEVLMGHRHPLIPPQRYNYINIGDNEHISKEFLKLFIEKGRLKPSDRVLEVGSGFGRMAIPLTDFLDKEGHYNGLEIIKDGVNWCTSKFTSKYSNFEFQHIDVYNERYNPNGLFKASEYKFPFTDESFDFVFLTSVFTHMFEEDVKNYLSEINRVLKKDGTCFITYFILDSIAVEQINNGLGSFSFKHQLKNCYMEDLERPEYAIAYKEYYIRKLYEKSGLKIIEPIYFGNWNGRKDYLSFQDIIIANNY